MLRAFDTTDGQTVWLDDRHIANVYGTRNNVKITVVGLNVQSAWTFKGDVSDVARTLNGYFDE